MDYSVEELADMHFIYGRANGNTVLAVRLYVERFPNRRIPNRKTFSRIHARLRETGSLKPCTSSGRPQYVRTVQREERILQIVEANPESSTRRIGRMERVSHMTVQRILHDNLLYPYHLQRVQALSVEDYAPRLRFCTWFLNKCNLNHSFHSSVLFTDEAGFTRDGIINFHNNHLWADENPHGIIQSRHQQRFSINVWAGIIGDYLIGPVVLPNRLDGLSYLDFLQNGLPPLLEEVPIETRQQMWFMHDGAPAHFRREVREYLNETYHNKWIGRGGPRAWPPRSPDLNPLDYYLWGHLKNMVYSVPISNVQILRQRVEMGCQQIREMPGIFGRVRQSMRKRIEKCIEVEGQHFQHLL